MLSASLPVQHAIRANRGGPPEQAEPLANLISNPNALFHFDAFLMDLVFSTALLEGSRSHFH
jgi:hypothetical protein